LEVKMFKHHVPTKLTFGFGAFDFLKEEVDSLSLPTERVAVICGRSAVEHGFAKRAASAFHNSTVEIFDLVKPDPTVENALEVYRAVEPFKPTLIVALGGGSPLDVAKAVSLLLTNGGNLLNYIGVPEPFKREGVPLVAVPTTAGSGSEVTPYAVLTDRERLRKAPLISRYLFPKLAVVDPKLTVSTPREVTVNSGVDALTHAVESFLSKRRTPVSALFSKEAFKRVFEFLPVAAGNPKDYQARKEVSLGSTLAGMAIADAGAGLIHTFAHAVGVLYRVPHGLANGLFLVPVLRFYGLSAKSELKELAETVGFSDPWEFLDALEEWLAFLGIPNLLTDVGAKEEELPKIAAMVNGKRFLMGNLPKIPTEREVLEILRSLI
jgi:alcohol dehydrogenase